MCLCVIDVCGECFYTFDPKEMPRNKGPEYQAWLRCTAMDRSALQTTLFKEFGTEAEFTPMPNWEVTQIMTAGYEPIRCEPPPPPVAEDWSSWSIVEPTPSASA